VIDMTAPQKRTDWTVAEYLAFERDSDSKHDWMDRFMRWQGAASNTTVSALMSQANYIVS
jgi:hypothetical protein